MVRLVTSPALIIAATTMVGGTGLGYLIDVKPKPLAAQTVAHDEPLALKGDREDADERDRLQPKPVHTVVIPVQAQQIELALPRPDPEPEAKPAPSPAAHRAEATSTDLCARHGMRREDYRGRNGWPMWRCVK